MSDWYDHTTYPANGASLSSSALRSELEAIDTAMQKLPVLTGNGGSLAIINAGGTAMEAVGSTGTGNVVRATSATMTTPTVSNGTFTNYVETVYAPAAGSAFTVDLANGTNQVFTTNANITITLPTPVAGKSYTIDVIYGGAHSVTFAGGGTLRWPSDVAPTGTSVSGKRDVFGFKSTDTTNTHGTTVGQAYAA